MMEHEILVVDDDPSALAYMALALEAAGHRAKAFSRASDLLVRMAAAEPALVITDLEMPEMRGLDLLATIKQRWPQVPVLIVTVAEDVATVVEAVQAGAMNYLVKPVPPHLLHAAVGKALARADAAPMGAPAPASIRIPEIIGVSSAIGRVRQSIVQAAKSDVNVVITGETGTGKELVARTLHRLYAAQSSFIAHNCALMPADLFDAEFFGHQRGAFTGADRSRDGLLARADGGVLFLDEVECLSLAHQAKLLRVLDDGEVRPLGADRPRTISVRFFAATNRPPEEMIRSGELREDFYYRLRGFEIALPSLDERPDDIPVLAAHFLRGTGKVLSQLALERMQQHRWRGNVRQLRNTLQAAVASSPDDRIGPEHLQLNAASEIRELSPRVQGSGAAAPAPAAEPKLALAEVKRETIQRAIAAHAGHMGRAAAALGVHRSTLRRKLRELGLHTVGKSSPATTEHSAGRPSPVPVMPPEMEEEKPK